MHWTTYLLCNFVIKMILIVDVHHMHQLEETCSHWHTGHVLETTFGMCAPLGKVMVYWWWKMFVVVKDIKQCSQLPLELVLGREFQFHSIFACPVSKDQSTTENPPMLMPCGHVLCEQSITKISKQKSRSKFKCPYCPMEAVSGNCRKLIFPDFVEWGKELWYWKKYWDLLEVVCGMAKWIVQYNWLNVEFCPHKLLVLCPLWYYW